MAGKTVSDTKVVGSAALMKRLNAAPKKLRTASRTAVTKAGRIVAKDAKGRVATRTEATKKAIGSKTAARKDGSGFVSIVGPRRDSKKAINASVAAVAAGKRKKAIKKRFARVAKYMGRQITVDPVKYAHFIEFGRKAVTPKKKKALAFTDRPGVVRKVKAAAPKPFLGPAFEASRQRVQDVVELTLAQAVAKLKR